MKTQTGLSCCRCPNLISQLYRFSHRSRLLLAGLFFMFMAVVSQTSAQSISNCVTVICPPQVVTNYTCDEFYTPAAYPIIVSNVCPGFQVQINCNPPPGTPLGVGAHPIHCVVTANGQVLANCDFWIIVERDTTPPSIKCPTNIFVNACPTPTGCGAVVNYPAPLATDNSGSVSVTCVPPSGSVFPCGTTVVTCTAEDRCKLTDKCEFTVTVSPNGQAPHIQCPEDITVETCSNVAQVVYTVNATPGALVICNPPSGSLFPIGSSSVLCTASNGCGTVECAFKVTVRKAAPPIIQCPTNQFIFSVPCGSNCVPVTYPLPNVLNGALEGCNLPPGTCLPVGIFTVSCRATNSCGETVACSFDIRVQQGQGEPPRILCPSNIVVTAPCGSNCVPVSYPAPTVANGVLVRCNPPPGSCFPVGITTVTCFATNDCAQVTCSFQVRVVQGQGQPPSILCPSNIVIETCRPNCDVVTYPLPGVLNGSLAGCFPPSGSCFPIGNTAVTCVATNQCASNSCTFIVTVRPVAPPGFLQCPTAPIIVTAPCGSNCVPVTYPIPTVVGGTLIGCTPSPGTCLPVGVYTVNCTATNKCGVTNVCSFPLEVRPGQGQPPVISCPTNTLVFRVPCATNCVPINYPLPAVANGVLVGCTPPPGTCLPVGSYAVVCKATNACSTVECVFKVEVVPLDGQPPVINCPSNIVVTAPCGSNCVPVVYSLPTVFNGALVGCNPPSGSCFPVGVTTVFCRATNNCGQVSGCEFTVTVLQSTAAGSVPGIRCPTNAIVLTVPCNTNCVPLNYPLPVVTNGVLVGCNPPIGTCVPVGTYWVVCHATNSCGQSAACEFQVQVVKQTQPPVINCPSNRVVTLPCGSNCVPIVYPLPTVVNGTLVNCTPPPGTCLPVGIYVVNCYATNSCGQSTKCEFQVRVIQGQGAPPIINCPSNIFVTVPCATNCLPVNYPAPFVTNGLLEGCSVPPGYCFPVGTNVVFCRATNACGVSLCSFDIIVRPGSAGGAPPSIKCPSNAVVTVPCGSNCVPISYPLPTVSNGTLAGCNPPIGTCLPVGNYFVVCYATNNCGQSAACEFPLYVVGGQGHPPIINCPTNVNVEVCSTNCTPVAYPMPTVLNGGLAGCFPPPTFCFPIGFTTVTCAATNACGSNSCSFVVSVRQTPYPQIKCPTNLLVTTCSNGAVVTYPLPTIIGSTNGTTVFCNPPSGTIMGIGTHVVTCCVVDKCERINCCEFTVTVKGGNPCVKPPVGMVLWLPFDELVGPLAANIIPAPNGFHANGPVPLPGQYVLNSLRFDGVNDFVRVPNYAAIVLSTSDLTIDAWVRRVAPDQGRRVIVSKLGQMAGANIPRGYEYYLNNGIMNLFLGGGAAQNYNSGVAVPADGNWHHVAVTVRRPGGGQVRFYLDGAIVNVQPGPITAPLANNNSLYVGAGTFPVPNNFFRGVIDEVEIFNRALAPAEIFALWNAQQSGKCKVICNVPWDVPIKPGTCITVMANVCNKSAVPQTINWFVNGPAITTAQSGSFILPPFTCTNIPIVVCSPAGTPAGTLLTWNFNMGADQQCPTVCMGSVITTGIIIGTPTDPTGVAGTTRGGIATVTLNGLPPGVPIRFTAIGPDMEPDMQYISLNGLPPGVPWELPGIGAGAAGDKAKAKAGEGIDVPIQFVEGDPIGNYMIVVEADVDGDGKFEPLSSFGVQNTVVLPPTLRLENGKLWWDDMGDGLGSLEAADSVDGPWTPIPGGPGTAIDVGGAMKFYRVAVPTP